MLSGTLKQFWVALVHCKYLLHKTGVIARQGGILECSFHSKQDKLLVAAQSLSDKYVQENITLFRRVLDENSSGKLSALIEIALIGWIIYLRLILS